MTALDHIKRALRMIGVIAESETPDAAQGETSLMALNGMLAGWESKGIRLELAPLVLSDDLPLPPNHDDAISYNLAISLAAEYGADVRPAVAKMADDGMAALQAMYAFIPTMDCDLALARIGRRTWGRVL